MNPRRWVHRSAWSSSLLALFCLSTPAWPQIAATERTTLELPPDPVARSPRLLGMGRLTLLDDRNNRLDLWDFAANPVGLYDTDSTSVLAVRPVTNTSSDARDFSVGELQTGASHDSRLQIDAIRRPGQGTTYGLLGEVTQNREDALFSIESEHRSLLTNPLAIPFITGELSFLDPKRFHYAMTGIFGVTDTRDQYRQLSTNGAGQYVDHTGTIQDPPDFFTPDQYLVRRVGGGLAVSYRASSSLVAALSGRFVSNGVLGNNNGRRNESENRERRPVSTAQATLVGHVGRNFQWAADGQAWSASSTTTWVFTLSPQGGPGPSKPPLTGRGDLDKRKEEGQRLKVEARWLAGIAQIGGSLQTYYQKVQITPSPLSSRTSFNSFREQVYAQPIAPDTLVLPGDVLSSDDRERDWEAVGGISAPFRHRRGIVAAEYHYIKRRLDALTGQGAIAEEINGAPPVASARDGVAWDVRAGAEYRWTNVLTPRLGYVFRSEDLDRLTQQNEYTSHTATAGIGVRPPGVRWTFDAGYSFEWVQADFGAPDRPRSTRQQLGVELRWDF